MLHPITKWAQRKDKIFLQVQLRDIQNQNIELTETTLSFAGDSDGQKFAFAFEFFSEVNKQQSKWTKTGFHLIFVLEKKDESAPFWARLLKTKEKNQYIQVDWSKWVDQDEEEQDGQKGMGGFDPSQMQNFGGQGGPGAGGFPGGFGGQGGFPGAGGFPGGFGGQGFPGGFGGDDGQEQQEQAEQNEHVHGENCNHQHEKKQETEHVHGENCHH